MKISIWMLLTLAVVVRTGATQSTPRKSACRKPFSRIVFRVRKNNLIDLTYPYDEDSAYWPSDPFGFQSSNIFTGFTANPRFYYSIKSFAQPEHLGTHMDAPSHFSQTGHAADDVSLYSVIGPGVLINLKENGTKMDQDSLVSIQDFLDWEKNMGGRIRSGSIVLLYTGYGDVYYNRAEYFGTNMTGNESTPHIQFPGLDPSAAEWLHTNRCIAAIGIDTASIDHGQSVDFRCHQILSAKNIPIFENVANLDKVDQLQKRFKIIALPQKIRGGTGAPIRIIAVAD